MIEANGWTVYRISGSDCMKNTGYVEDEHGFERIVLSPAYKLIKDIAEAHGIRFAPSKNRKTLADMIDHWIDFGEPATRAHLEPTC